MHVCGSSLGVLIKLGAQGTWEAPWSKTWELELCHGLDTLVGDPGAAPQPHEPGDPEGSAHPRPLDGIGVHGWGLVPVDATQSQRSLGWGHQHHPLAPTPGIWILLPAGISCHTDPFHFGKLQGTHPAPFFFLLQLHSQQPGSALCFPALSLQPLTFLVGRVFFVSSKYFP